MAVPQVPLDLPDVAWARLPGKAPGEGNRLCRAAFTGLHWSRVELCKLPASACQFFFGSIIVFDLSAAACLGTDYEQPMTFLRSGGCLAELPLMVASLIVPQLVSFFPAQLDMSPCRRLPTSAGLWRRRTCARHLGGGAWSMALAGFGMLLMLSQGDGHVALGFSLVSLRTL